MPLDKLMAPGPLPDMVMGDANAPVTIVEYASMTCPHCAEFYKDTMPALKARYIDTGKVRFIFREFPLDNLAAAASMLARCSGPVRYFPFIAVMFETQQAWAFAEGDPVPRLLDMAKQAGFTEESFKSCLADKSLLDGIKQIRETASKDFGVEATPTLFVNGIKLKEGHSIEDIEKVMAPWLKG
ncbi:MAG: DsbA family protein [Hyphomicrobiaceae bacterium]